MAAPGFNDHAEEKLGTNNAGAEPLKLSARCPGL
jgi:hypothetical protein